MPFSTEFALDEVECLLSVDVHVLLVVVGVSASAAVRVGGVTVALDQRRAVRRALEARRTSGKLDTR